MAKIVSIVLVLACGALFALAEDPRQVETPRTTPFANQSPKPEPKAKPDQEPKPPVDPGQGNTTRKKEKRGDWVFAPIPIRSPTVGSGLILGAGYIFKFKKDDTKSPPSTIAGGGAFTSNGSRGFALAGSLKFAQNKYQATPAFGRGRIRYDFFGIGRLPGEKDRSVEIEQDGRVFFAEFLVNLGKNVFVGPRYQNRKLTAAIRREPTEGGFEVPAIDLDSTTAGIGFKIKQDTRDSSFYPRKGHLWEFKADFFRDGLGSKRDYNKFGAAYNGFYSIGQKQVLAYRGSACSVGDDAPFYDVCFFGGSDLRGYAMGRFQDRRMFAAQAEFRQELPWRIGLVGFAGFGGVAKRWDEFSFDELLPAAGLGLRFKIEKTNHINYSIDFGFGRDGHTISISVLEAF